MLFGRHEAEEVAVGSLNGYAIALFDSKLRKVNARCGRSLAKLESALKDFESACIELGALEAVPDLESISSGASKAIAEQKPRYVKELTSVIASLRQDLSKVSEPTKYEEVLAKKTLIEGAVEDMLKLNSLFRGVLIGYGGYFGDIKRTFKAVENSLSALKFDIDGGSVDFLNHKNLVVLAGKLTALLGEFSASSAENSALRQNSKFADNHSTNESERAKLLGRIDEISKNIESAEQKKKSVIASINSMLAPLERAARKYDHGSASKFKLADAIKNPLDAIHDSESYSRFVAALKDMQSKIAAIEPNPKELDLIQQQLGMVLSSNILDSIYEISEFEGKENALLGELNDAKALLADIDRIRKGKEDIENAIKANEEKQAAILAKISSTKENIEKLFYVYYKKKVRIRIG
ncbi:MAG: hypothetical protein QW696_00650 [Candidatus Micrarchaeaceae archaeon]